ncbi:MAG: hypothetical protein ACPGOV_02960 [Magnetovibrionaceae bacterium]
MIEPTATASGLDVAREALRQAVQQDQNALALAAQAAAQAAQAVQPADRNNGSSTTPFRGNQVNILA